MTCPYCCNEMIEGQVKGEIAPGFGASWLYWDDESVEPSIFHPAGVPLVSDFGDEYKGVFVHPAIKSYRCPHCRIILMEAYLKK